MKISDLLCQYLYQNKELVLEGFGVFTMDPAVNPTEAKDPPPSYQGITFENNLKIKTPSSLLDFLVERSGKMRSLAQSDLEAFLTTGRELLNIGKPLILNGIGTLTGQVHHQLEFVPGPFIPARLEGRAAEPTFRERVATSEDELFTADEGGSLDGQRRMVLIIVAALLLLLLAGWGIYHFAFQKKSTSQDTSAIQPVLSDGAPAARQDTTASSGTAAADSSGKMSAAAASHSSLSFDLNGPVTFRVLIQTFHDSVHAERRYDSLRKWGHQVEMHTRDSTYYIIMPTSLPLADTTMVRDSLSNFFGRRVYILPVRH